MNYSKGLLIKVVLLLVISVSLAPACAVCFGNPESNMVQGMNKAILVLMAVIGSILASFAAFFIYLNKKGKSVQRSGNLNA